MKLDMTLSGRQVNQMPMTAQENMEPNHTFRCFEIQDEKPAYLVTRITDSTSVQRTYRGLWRPNQHFLTTVDDAFHTEPQSDREAKRYIFALSIFFVLVITARLGPISRGTFQAGSLLLCLGIVYILLYFIIFYTYIVDYMLLLINMANCSPECIDVIVGIVSKMLEPINSLLTASIGISLALAVTISFIMGGITIGGSVWWIMRRSRRRDSTNINQSDGLDDKIILCVSQKITDYDTLRRLGVELKIKLVYIQRLQNEQVGIWDAASKVLLEWCGTQDGLHLGSKGLETLKIALQSAEKTAWIQEINQLVQLHQER